MSGSRLDSMLQHLRKVLAHAPGAEVSDAELLERFVKTADQAAFELLVWRHERMVFGVCRRVLRNYHDAEDAFQATFLVLARKAASIGNRQAVAGWLHRVASRVAHHARSQASRRERPRSHDADLASLPCPREPGAELLARDLGLVLDEEVARLPEKYRLPVVLCYLEGKTYEQAARQLGCPKGTLSARLTRARGMLQARLMRRGVSVGAGLLATVLCEHAASAAVPAALVTATLKAALLVASGRATAGATVPAVAALAEGVLRGMMFHQLKFASVLLATLLVCTVAGSYVSVLCAGGSEQSTPAENRVAATSAQSLNGAAQGDACPGARARKPKAKRADKEKQARDKMEQTKADLELAEAKVKWAKALVLQTNAIVEQVKKYKLVSARAKAKQARIDAAWVDKMKPPLPDKVTKAKVELAQAEVEYAEAGVKRAEAELKHTKANADQAKITLAKARLNYLTEWLKMKPNAEQ